uniref:Uncharacterized protein n=1 Tax=Candidatus Kentrum sp. FM TaxID=2126340 RepID=A0A450T0J6_9GAMM|nr:MAG: hypothetical protein BECKFM1743C_GA0114222_102634 [Candidatus Kentron sp. FM]VFJ60041.1 MAG: hypothetical protein BECKFM1743A_GA0114220_102543 [Candidatus Kentron sp. FM]VFK13208.1 MAG: hypothetical protein BECKFM1743B_GA0114221_102694 [Candidatus Kentron sp. FM]
MGHNSVGRVFAQGTHRPIHLLGIVDIHTDEWISPARAIVMHETCRAGSILGSVFYDYYRKSSGKDPSKRAILPTSKTPWIIGWPYAAPPV